MNILIAPLNWGIGHATRITPIIKHLQKSHTIFIAADGNSYAFLKQYFYNIKIYEAPKLNIKYPKNPKFMPLKMLFSLPKLSFFYIQNKIWVHKFTKKHNIDLIISDNRFGFFSKKIKSVFITHQLNIQIPRKYKFANKFVQFLNRKNIEKFNECLIPDSSAARISGILSDTQSLKIPTKFIGILSRFHNIKPSSNINKYDIFCIISGAEPQRTLLENLLIDELQKNKHKTLLISGLPQKNFNNKNKNLTIKNHISDQEFSEITANTEIIIVRSGYSTIMDLIALKKTAILIPTPGQTEQEYLANYLHNKKIFFCVKQNNLNLQQILNDFAKVKDTQQKNLETIANEKNNFFTNLDV